MQLSSISVNAAIAGWPTEGPHSSERSLRPGPDARPGRPVTAGGSATTDVFQRTAPGAPVPRDRFSAPPIPVARERFDVPAIPTDRDTFSAPAIPIARERFDVPVIPADRDTFNTPAIPVARERFDVPVHPVPRDPALGGPVASPDRRPESAPALTAAPVPPPTR